MTAMLKITALPARYEPLVGAFGDKARMTFVPPDADLGVFKRFMVAAESARQGKLMFVSGGSGAGKSTFVHSLEIFLPDEIDRVVRLPQPHELPVEDIPRYVAGLPAQAKFTVVNFDGREAPYFDEPQYQTFLGALNAILRTRKDLLIVWPVTDLQFAEKLVGLLKKAGGRSVFGPEEIHRLRGIPKEKYGQVLEKILQVANWRLDDAAVSSTEVDALIGEAERLGGFLDDLQALIAQRFDTGHMGVTFPTLVIAISSGDPKIRETCRSLRRADSFYIEASRLLMYTKRSNVAEWWGNRATDLKAALPHVIALFNAQLVSMSASAVVHAVLQGKDADLKAMVQGVRADSGNAKRVIASSELCKFFAGEPVDNREYGSSVKDETFESFARIQQASEVKHRAINEALVNLAVSAGQPLQDLRFEAQLVTGLQTDATYKAGSSIIALECHHKAEAESSPNKVAIYVLEKLQEYAINYGLATR
jgi:energy-coupling factor transporter ATP-binding protein EcfA2